MNIGVFDSGIGGLTVLDEVVRLIPNYSYIFYGDTANNPYGEKSDEELIKITSDIVDRLNEQGCKLIIIACNTATTRCRNKLMELYPDNVFIGTVPAVKLACDQDYKNILVMATPATIDSERLHQIADENIRADQNIYYLPCPGLANAIERNDEDEINQILDELFEPYYDKNIDAVVLGCTHYPFIKKEIAQRLPDAVLLDGSNGVAREARHQLIEHGWYNENDEPCHLEFTFTK